MKILIFAALVFLILLLSNSPTLFPPITIEEKIAELYKSGDLTDDTLKNYGIDSVDQISEVELAKIERRIELDKKEKAAANLERTVNELSHAWYNKPIVWLVNNFIFLLKAFLFVVFVTIATLFLSRFNGVVKSTR